MVARTCIVIETSKIVFEKPAQVCGKVCLHQMAFMFVFLSRICDGLLGEGDRF